MLDIETGKTELKGKNYIVLDIIITSPRTVAKND